MAETKRGKCFLCSEEKELRNSHIIPKFMTKQIREHPSRVYIIDNGLEIKQDTIKYYMLCDECEGKFNKLETYFSKDIVKNYKNKSIKYSDKLYIFILSVIWRIMEFRIATVEQYEKRRYEEALSIKNTIRTFLHIGENLEYQEVYMFILDSGKEFDFTMLASRKKIKNITYSIYGRFTNNSNVIRTDCQKDSATNYSLIQKMPFTIEKFPFSYFNVFHDDDHKILFVVVEQFIFCFNLLGESLNFPEQSKIVPKGGIWEDVQFPSKINEYLNRYGEEVNLDTECSEEEIGNILTCLKKKGIITARPH